MSADGKTLIRDGVSYTLGDQVYVHPETFDQLEQAALAEVPDYAAKGRFHKVGVKRFGPTLSLCLVLCSSFLGSQVRTENLPRLSLTSIPACFCCMWVPCETSPNVFELTWYRA